MPRDPIREQLLAVYEALFRAYGPQHWWPGDSPFEMMVGAVLTQNTSWINVEKAIANLKREDCLTAQRMLRLDPRRLAALIRPSGYYQVKAKRLAHLAGFLVSHYGGSHAKMLQSGPDELRKELLSVHGIGPETADSIMLYATGHPMFVVDAYTRRIFGRHGMAAGNDSYHDLQRRFHEHLPRDARLFNEYHALIVRLGKEYCRKTEPRCSGCPLQSFPQYELECSSVKIKILRQPARLHKILCRRPRHVQRKP